MELSKVFNICENNELKQNQKFKKTIILFFVFSILTMLGLILSSFNINFQLLSFLGCLGLFSNYITLNKIKTEEKVQKIFKYLNDDISKNIELYNIYKKNQNSFIGVFYNIIYVKNALEMVIEGAGIHQSNTSSEKIIPLNTEEMNNLSTYLNGVNKYILAKTMYYYEFQLDRLETNIKDLE